MFTSNFGNKGGGDTQGEWLFRRQSMSFTSVLQVSLCDFFVVLPFHYCLFVFFNASQPHFTLVLNLFCDNWKNEGAWVGNCLKLPLLFFTFCPRVGLTLFLPLTNLRKHIESKLFFSCTGEVVHFFIHINEN